MQNENSGISIPLRGSRQLVTSLDPDSTLRQGRNLHDLDQVISSLILFNNGLFIFLLFNFVIYFSRIQRNLFIHKARIPAR